MVLGGQPPGRVGRCRDNCVKPRAVAVARASARLGLDKEEHVYADQHGRFDWWRAGRAPGHHACRDRAGRKRAGAAPSGSGRRAWLHGTPKYDRRAARPPVGSPSRRLASSGPALCCAAKLRCFRAGPSPCRAATLWCLPQAPLPNAEARVSLRKGGPLLGGEARVPRRKPVALRACETGTSQHKDGSASGTAETLRARQAERVVRQAEAAGRPGGAKTKRTALRTGEPVLARGQRARDVRGHGTPYQAVSAVAQGGHVLPGRSTKAVRSGRVPGSAHERVGLRVAPRRAALTVVAATTWCGLPEPSRAPVRASAQFVGRRRYESGFSGGARSGLGRPGAPGRRPCQAEPCQAEPCQGGPCREDLAREDRARENRAPVARTTGSAYDEERGERPRQPSRTAPRPADQRRGQWDKSAGRTPGARTFSGTRRALPGRCLAVGATSPRRGARELEHDGRSASAIWNAAGKATDELRTSSRSLSASETAGGLRERTDWGSAARGNRPLARRKRPTRDRRRRGLPGPRRQERCPQPPPCQARFPQRRRTGRPRMAKPTLEPEFRSAGRAARKPSAPARKAIAPEGKKATAPSGAGARDEILREPR